jgi:GH18 family chitinase
MSRQPPANKGNIVAYHPDYRGTPSNEQLDRLTHLVLFSVEPAHHDVPLPGGRGNNWPGNINDVVDRAHARGVKVIIAMGGWGKTGSFPESVKPANRQTFVNNIMALVNQYHFDGVDIDWEYPDTAEEVAHFEGFMAALKTALGSDRRLSFAIGAQYQPNKYTDATYDALDALHLMTYDHYSVDHHADMAWSKGVVDQWVNSGKLAKEKIFYGVPFYGRSGSNKKDQEIYAAIINSNQAVYSQTDSANGYRYDGIPHIKEKTKYAWDKDIGGIMIWETGQDIAATNQYSLLGAIYEETRRLKGE